MRSNGTRHNRGRAADAWLILSVHADAFRAAPRPYLIAAWWRLRGKRVRSRSQFASLLTASPGAYGLWLRRQDIPVPTDSDLSLPPIFALVVTGQGGLDVTLASLADEGVSALIVGSPHVPTLAHAIEQIDWSEGPWLMPMIAGDQLAPGAVAAYRAAMARSDARVIYADDDRISASGQRTAPHFKPDWNSELFRHFDYLSGACVLHPSRAEIEALADTDDWAHRLTAQLVGQGAPLHVHRMLHHRRQRPGPRIPAALEPSAQNLPPVTIIVPTRNRVDLLRTCLNGIAATDYPDVQVIVADNDSDDPETLAYLAGIDPKKYQLLRCPGAFNFSAINNRGADAATGRLLCLLNNDIEVIDPNWLATMAVQALRADVGAVGARLLYPGGHIQHAGVVLGVGGGAAHAHRLLDPEEEGYFRRHALPQFVSAVTAACLVVTRERFLAVGGLDEQHFPVAFNDVDLCMRLNRRGWQSLYEPRATLIHHESLSRGFDRDPVGAARFAGEMAALQQRWGTRDMIDPFHHPELSRVSERFVVRL